MQEIRRISEMKIYLTVFILCVYVCNHGYTESIWVGPAWGLDDQPGVYNYGVREVDQKTNRGLQPLWIPDSRAEDSHANSGHDPNKKLSRALEEGSKLSKFYCNTETNASCPFGGKGPTLIKKLSPKLAICVCYCPSGYSKDYGCVE